MLDFKFDLKIKETGIILPIWFMSRTYLDRISPFCRGL